MSIWSTVVWVDLPYRDEYGQTETTWGAEYAYDIATCGCSKVLRFTAIDHFAGSEAELLLTPAEARTLAAQLIAAADLYPTEENPPS